MNLNNVSYTDSPAPRSVPTIDLLPDHERGLVSLRLQMGVAKLDSARGRLAEAYRVYEAAQERCSSIEEKRRLADTRQEIAGAIGRAEAALEHLLGIFEEQIEIIPLLSAREAAPEEAGYQAPLPF